MLCIQVQQIRAVNRLRAPGMLFDSRLCDDDTVRCRCNAVKFLINVHKRHPIARPLGRGVGCLLSNPASDWYSATVPVIIYAISCYIRPRYNGTRLYYLIFKLSSTFVYMATLQVYTLHDEVSYILHDMFPWGYMHGQHIAMDESNCSKNRWCCVSMSIHCQPFGMTAMTNVTTHTLNRVTMTGGMNQLQVKQNKVIFRLMTMCVYDPNNQWMSER